MGTGGREVRVRDGERLKVTRQERLEKEWEKIAQDAITESEKVKCSMEEFLDGLKDIAGTIMDRRSMG